MSILLSVIVVICGDSALSLSCDTLSSELTSAVAAVSVVLTRVGVLAVVCLVLRSVVISRVVRTGRTRLRLMVVRNWFPV